MDAELIVRALAAADAPFDREYGTCAFCGMQDPDNHRAAPIPEATGPHKPDCPWQLAREWVATHPA